MAKEFDFDDEDALEDLDEEELVDEDALIEEDEDLIADEAEADIGDEDFDDGQGADDDQGDEEDDEEDGDGEEGEDETEWEDIQPRSKVTALTMVLCVLNILAACAFAFLLMMDYGKRQNWSYANFLFDLRLWGLPLEMEGEKKSASRETRPKFQLTAKQVAEQFRERMTGASVPESQFKDVHEMLKERIKPEHLTEGVLKDVYRSVGGPHSKTLEEEVNHYKQKLPADVERAAKKIVESDAMKNKSEADIRKELENLLLPMAHTSDQIEYVAAELAKKPAAELRPMLAEAIQRKMLFDLLRILQMYRPWGYDDPATKEEEKNPLTKVVGKEAIKLERLQDLTAQRIEDVVQAKSRFADLTRVSYEKRENIAFLLTAIHHLNKPIVNEPLYSSEPDAYNRVEVAVGVVEYNAALITLTKILETLHEQAEDRIDRDREGQSFTVIVDGSPKTFKLYGFVGKHRQQVQELLEIVANIEYQRRRIKQFEGTLAKTTDLYKDRMEDYQALRDQLKEAHELTQNMVKELKRLNVQLFAAQKELAGLAELNRALEERIRGLEEKLGIEKAGEATLQ